MLKKIGIIFAVLVGITIIILTTAWVIFNQKSTVSNGSVYIFEGANVRQATDILEREKIIQSADFFYFYLRTNQMYQERYGDNLEDFQITITPGTYEIEKGDFKSLIVQLNEGGTQEDEFIAITIPESWTVEQMAQRFEENGLFEAEEFLAYIQDEDVYQDLRDEYEWLIEPDDRRYYYLEGFLQANTYHFPLEVTKREVVKTMLDETNKWYVEYKEEMEQLGYTFDEIITIASVVERESMYSEDRPKVAQVIYNRLARGMKLEMDATSQYANQEHKVFVYYSDIANESEYNTYHVPALPVGPIGSPSTEALTATFLPEGSEFKALYFYSRPNGETHFEETWQAHENNRIDYEHEWKELERELSENN